MSVVREILTDERLVRRIEWANGIFLLVFTVGAWGIFSGRAAAGVFAGGVISILSFEILKWQLQRAFRNPDRVPGKGRLFISYYLRFLGTVFVIFTVIYYKWVDPMAFLVGLSVVVAGLFSVGFGEYIIMLQRGER